MKKLELLFLKTSFRCQIREKKLQPKILIKLFLEYFSRLFEVKIEKYDFHFGVNRQSINEKFDRAQMKSEKKNWNWSVFSFSGFSLSILDFWLEKPFKSTLVNPHIVYSWFVIENFKKFQFLSKKTCLMQELKYKIF